MYDIKFSDVITALLGTNIFLKGFSWFLDMFLSIALSYRLVYSVSIGCLRDILYQKLFVAFEASNCWISKHLYVKTEESVKTEWDISYYRTTIEQKQNINFILAPAYTVVYFDRIATFEAP